MDIQKPSIPRGTRDFGTIETVRRNYIFNTIKEIFQLFGYAPIETPAMENLSTLMGKYGEEGDKLLFKILNSGDFLSSVSASELENGDSNNISALISEKGLRYDLTVPFARYVVQHFNEITFPFKRYQIQPVWRADRPQKGRYREFYQCDADVIGSNSQINEAELVQIIDEVFKRLKINVTVKFNNRKILAGIAETIGRPGELIPLTIAMDKLEKAGLEKVVAELKANGFSDENISKLKPVLEFIGDTEAKLTFLQSMLQGSETGLKGLKEINSFLDYLKNIKITADVELDLTLARGLNYYTGAIFEVKAKDVSIGSICGGGRYDDLTGIFGLKNVSGVGISFGADRIYDVLEQLTLFPQEVSGGSKVLFVNFGNKEEKICMSYLPELRKNNISAEIYPDPAKLKKQMNYANAKSVAYVVLVGEDEINEGKITVKNMITGSQEKTTLEHLIAEILNP
ncbi:MAG: histidine--tRNA ligase [Bacteroidales bacterium]|nr:histidine--tRNA ligase [Bacteroidales bacterium]